MRSGAALPVDDQPYWFRSGQPLANYQSSPRLPSAADVVIIGAGLTGASAAYHLGELTRAGRLRVVVLDQGDPAGEASGRNGGNFELIPENSIGAYEGLAKERLDFLMRRYRGVPREILTAESERQASLVFGIALRNRDLLKNIILREQIECDFSPRGWLHIACSDEEELGICAEVNLAARHGQRVEIWPRGKIRNEFGFTTEFVGRFVPGDGTYHPFKYTCGLLSRAIDAGVELHTRVKVRSVESHSRNRHQVVTEKGTIKAKQVIVATNAFTSALFPELESIRAYQSQIMLTENAPDRTRGRVVTCNDGPIFFNQPRDRASNGRAPLLLGGGADRPMRNPSSRRRSIHIHARLMHLRDRFFPELQGREASAEWIGPMGFTPDQLPALGFLQPGVVVVAGFNGYGGSYTTAAGLAAAEMVTSARPPEWVPEDVFSPRRLLSRTPMFMTQKDSLWRIAAALSRQLRQVNRQVVETTLVLASAAPQTNGRRAPKAGPLLRGPAGRIEPSVLKRLPSFRDFKMRELAALSDVLRLYQASEGTTVFLEGTTGRSCYVVVSGAVAITTELGARTVELGTLHAGSIFGEMSLLDGDPRSATCTVIQDAILAELDARTCTRLIQNERTLGLKLLSLMNESLIGALRLADLRLLRVQERAANPAAALPTVTV